MKIAVILSGTIRQPEKSLASIQKFAGHEVDTYIHCWRNVAMTQQDSWSKVPSMEPTNELIEQYKTVALETEDWTEIRPRFVAQVEKWYREYKLNAYTTYGALGQFYSLQRAFSQIPHRMFDQYDLYVRMRFDLGMIDNPIEYAHACGWHVPDETDFGGVQDRFSFFCANNQDRNWNYWQLCGVFNIYDQIDDWIRQGHAYHPEKWMQLGLQLRHGPHRPQVKFTTH